MTSVFNLFVNSIWTTKSVGEDTHQRTRGYLTLLLLTSVFAINVLIINDRVGRLLLVPYLYALHSQMGSVNAKFQPRLAVATSRELRVIINRFKNTLGFECKCHVRRTSSQSSADSSCRG